MAYPISEVFGLSEEHQSKLAEHRISNTDHLVRLRKDPSRMHEVSRETGFPIAQLRRWVNLAEMMAIAGIGPAHAALLHAAGVDSLGRLANRDPRKLAARLVDAARLNREAPTPPSPRTLARWIVAARELESVRGEY
jgi:nucleotidyltransferase/DNA polymerase involved in DNA repair